METGRKGVHLVKKLETSLPLFFTIAFVLAWTLWKISIASSKVLPTWDGMVYWIIGQNFLQGRYPVYEFFRPPLLPLFLGFTQLLGLSIGTAFLWHPIVTGLSGLVLYLVLRSFVRDWLAAAGAAIFLTTSVVQLWSTTILTHGFATLFLLSGIYFLLQGSFKTGVLGASFLTLALFTRYPLGLVIIPVAIWFALRHRKVIDIDAILLGGILPLIPVLLPYPQGLPETVSEIYRAEILGQKSAFVGGSALPTIPPPTVYASWILNNLQFLTIFLVIGILAAIKYRKGLVFALWFVPYLVGFSLFANRQDRFLFELAPAMAALVVLGGETLLQRFKSVKLLPLLILVLVAFYAVDQTLVALPQEQSIWEFPFPGFSNQPASFVTTFQLVGREIQLHSQPLDIVMADDKVPWLAYYSSRFVYLARLGQVTEGTVLQDYLRSFNPYPTLLVAVPLFGDNISLIQSQAYLQPIETINTPAWGQVYLFQVTLS
jgi:4-amino-4-deoxy-L-arabinose transferase-like glycosyltransferase